MAKLKINCVPVIPPEDSVRNITHARTLGLPFASEKKDRPPLMVLGGGHSIRTRVDEVRAFKGDKWIIGSSFRFWREQGVDGRFFSVHPSPAALDNIEGVTKALLATVTDPQVFERLKGADIEIFDLVRGGVVTHATTTATVAPCLAVELGYRQIALYGCDSSYHGSTHAYMNVNDPYLMRVRCGDKEFLTGAEFLMQAEFLAEVIRMAPHVFLNCSGGLLAALVEQPNYDVLAISKTLHESAQAA